MFHDPRRNSTSTILNLGEYILEFLPLTRTWRGRYIAEKSSLIPQRLHDLENLQENKQNMFTKNPDVSQNQDTYIYPSANFRSAYVGIRDTVTVYIPRGSQDGEFFLQRVVGVTRPLDEEHALCHYAVVFHH
jgi:hypothetical protein